MITVIANLKGGTGKSTVTFNLAIWLRSTDRRIAVIDLDPQKTLTDAAALRTEEQFDPSVPVEAGAFQNVTFPEDAEEIIIDVGTADLESFKQAIMIADRILIPVTPSQADIWSTQRFVRFLYKNTHGNPPESITFLNRVDTDETIHAPAEAAAALNTLPCIRLIPQRLSDHGVYRDSLSEGLAVFELEPSSAASREFKALAESLFGRAHRSVLDRLRKQKKSIREDPAFRQALETPAAGIGVTERVGYEDVMPEPAVKTVPKDREQVEQGKKKRKKASKEKQLADTLTAKSRKKAKKSTKGKKEKKGKKGRKGKKKA